MKTFKSRCGVTVATLLLGASFGLADANGKAKMGTLLQTYVDEAQLGAQVRHALVMLPWYGLFDNLQYSVRGDTVVLTGQVTRPTLKSDAEAAVRKLEGVSNAVNNIEVLPLSPNDDRIRLATYRALFSRSGLDRYALRAVPSIHILVKNGHVTLVGNVSRSADRIEAGIAALTVPGVFSVTNDLTV